MAIRLGGPVAFPLPAEPFDFDNDSYLWDLVHQDRFRNVIDALVAEQKRLQLGLMHHQVATRDFEEARATAAAVTLFDDLWGIFITYAVKYEENMAKNKFRQAS
ncbi:MAG: hypothetical protein GY906_22490 [bacterium]|nr:hypothetical protein [bacterium]